MMDWRDLRLADRLRDLKLRELINENTAVVTIAAVVLLMISMGVLVLNLTGGGDGGIEQPTLRYFYDLNTGQLFEMPWDELPPVDRGTPFALNEKMSIPAGVETFVVGCEACGLESSRRIGWVETLRPEVREQLIEARNKAEAGDGEAALYFQDTLESERLVMDVEAPEPVFLPKYTREAAEIIDRAMTCPEDGSRMRLCYP